MEPHFSVRDVTYTPAADSVTIVVETDVPCTLICRQTSQTPRIHKKPVMRRGEWLADDVRFCFAVFTNHYQEEAEETLIHTFIKTAWPPCTTRWLYFWATIDGEVCVSTSAIFGYHNPYVIPPLPELTRYARSRPFNQYGAFIARSAGKGLAAIFKTPATLTWAYQFHLFARNKEDVMVRVSLRSVDDDNKPIGGDLTYRHINLVNGVEDGGDGGVNPVYRHIIDLPHIFVPDTNYALVSMTITNSAQWWITFRNQGWIGDKDQSTLRNVDEFYTQDWGANWIHFPPSHQCHECWGYEF